jgi:hypothetical protein
MKNESEIRPQLNCTSIRIYYALKIKVGLFTVNYFLTIVSKRKGPANGTSSIKLALRNRFSHCLKAETEPDLKRCVLITPKTTDKVQEINAKENAIFRGSCRRFNMSQCSAAMPYLSNDPGVGCWRLISSSLLHIT